MKTIGIYLTHSAHQQIEGEEWEKRLCALDPRIKVLNPFKKHIGEKYQEAYDKAKHARRTGIEMTEDIMTPELSDALVDSDLEGVRKQDILVAIFPPKEFHTAGGICEMFYASRICPYSLTLLHILYIILGLFHTAT